MASKKIPFWSAECHYIAPHNSDTFNPPFSALFVAGAGNIVVRCLKGGTDGGSTVVQALTMNSVPAGATLTGLGPIVGVNATSTTATGIIGVI